MSQQLNLFPREVADTIEGRTADAWADSAAGSNAIDEVFAADSRYRSSREYLQLLDFIAGLPQYSAFNCFLLYIQNSAITHVATARTWARRFGRRLKFNARPLVILAPMGPVRFVYDLKDTEGEPLASESLRSHPPAERLRSGVYENTIHNCALQGIAVRDLSTDELPEDTALRMTPSIRKKYSSLNLAIEASYLVMLDPSERRDAKYAKLARELGHIFCGHLGIDKSAWWPERHHLRTAQEEMEAESVAFLICRRNGVAGREAKYLPHHAAGDQQIPVLSLNAILQAVNYIEAMGRARWRKPKRRGRY